MEERSAVQMENVQPYDTICGLAKVHPTKHKNSFVILPARGHGPSLLLSPAFTSRVNLTHTAEKNGSMGELLYTRAKVKQIGILQTTPTAKADMWYLCKRTPKLLIEIYKPHGHTSRAKYMASVYRKEFGESCKGLKVVGEGFGIMNRVFKINSGAFNPVDDDYHDNSSLMNQDSARYVEAVVNI